MEKATMRKPRPNIAPEQLRPQDIDRYVGSRLRNRRVMMGLTQQSLASLIGVTYQQEHKYEKGINRISGGRLFQMAQALGVEVAYFYEGLHDPRPIEPTKMQRLLLELTRNFIDIPSLARQEAICALVRALADRDGGSDNSDVVDLLPEVDAEDAA
ncbi:MAG: helix-turn-helix transcriptional regulator [Geminicoccaceae bacterium]